MTGEEFIEILKERGYSYEEEGDRIIVTHRGYVYLDRKTLPPGVEFKNGGHVWLKNLETLPPGVAFKNDSGVILSHLKTLPPGVAFKNGGGVNLSGLETLPPGVEFKNDGDVGLKGILGRWLNRWEGNIEGVENKRLLNLMISKGVFI